jgi:hypothetical protein
MSIHQPAPESRFAKSSHATVSTRRFIRTYQRTIPPRPVSLDFPSEEPNSPLQRSTKSSVQGVTDVQELRETASHWNKQAINGSTFSHEYLTRVETAAKALFAQDAV